MFQSLGTARFVHKICPRHFSLIDPVGCAALLVRRGRFPKSYGGELVDILQGSLTEQAYKDILDKAGGPRNGLQPGYEELGFTKAEAEACVAKLAEEERIAEEEAARIAAEKAEVSIYGGGGNRELGTRGCTRQANTRSVPLTSNHEPPTMNHQASATNPVL